MIDTDYDRKQALGGLALGFGFFLLAQLEAWVRSRDVVMHGFFI